MVKVSMVVPVYMVKRELLVRCIESLICQTIKEIEIILVDDGSPDECGQICDELALKDERIVVLHKDNGGVSSARNFGVKHSKGEYVGFVDSDDYVESDFCEKLFFTAKKYDADMVCSGYRQLKNNEKKECNVIGSEDYVFDDIDCAVEQFILFNKIDFRVWNKFFRKSIAEKILFSEKYSIAEDEMYIFDFMHKSKKVVYIPYCGYNYYINTESVMSSSLSKKNFDAMIVTEKISSELKNQKIENINYFKLNTYVRLWVKISSEPKYCEKYGKEKSYIEKKIKEIPVLKVKFNGNKTLMLIFIPMKVSRSITEFIVRKFDFISKKVSL